MIIHIIVAQNMVLCQDKAVEISLFCQLAETLNMQLLDLTQPTHKASASFEGKTALITGASSGLGEQFARCLSGAGARVISAARNRGGKS